MDDKLTAFILEHEQDDTARLLLGRSRWPDIDMDLAVHTIEGRRRIRTKVPAWYPAVSLRYPTRLCTEQCSSAATARCKAALAARILALCHPEHPRIADLTGGLGVDAWAFAGLGAEVLHNEMDPVLSAAVRHNFQVLGLQHVVFRNACTQPGAVAGILDGFAPDLIFLDPARRASDGRKVFRLEDCQPDILRLLPELLEAAPHLLLKISPMADISLIVKQLQEAVPERSGLVREVRTIGADGECKELLLWLDREWTGPHTLSVTVCDIGADAMPELSFAADAEKSAVPVLALPEEAKPGALLFEPGKALAKTGLFNALSARFGLPKLSRHTHLYLLPEDQEEALASFGKIYRIREVHELSGRTFKTLGKAWPQADVTARDIPMTSDELRKRLGTRSGGSVHLFGCRIGADPVLLVTQR